MAQFYLYTTTRETLLLDDEKWRLCRLEGKHFVDISQNEVPRRAIEMLCLLVKERGKQEFVQYDDLVEKIKRCDRKKLNEWAGKLREVFQDRRSNARIILTKPNVGYRFTGGIDPLDHELSILQTNPSESWLDKLWDPYLKYKKTTAVYTEATMFRSPDIKVLIRHTDVNRRRQEENPTRLPPITEEMKTCWLYVPSGEMNFLLSLSNWLSARQVSLSYFPSHQVPYWTLLLGTDVILTGTIRANWMLKDLPNDLPDELKDFDFEPQEYQIFNHDPRTGEKKEYIDNIPLGESSGQIYALVNRIRTLEGRTLTILTGSHSRAFEGVWKFPESEEIMTKLVKEGFIRNGRFPKRFQLLFAVKLDRDEQYAGIDCKGWRAIEYEDEEEGKTH